SLAIIGICIILFVLMVPAFIYTRLPIYLSILFDGISVGVYLYMLTYLTASSAWLWELAIPILILVTVLVEIFVFLIRILPTSTIATALYFFAEVGILCIGIELFIDLFLAKSPALSWSAIVLTICGIIVIALATLLSVRRLREAVRRRLHF
ncbi:MAG: hypothetical protein IKM28_05585, partial [Lachnospiraceae bacterium]|nr:hypothetical protein [Lachnospiraceae bacterium]